MRAWRERLILAVAACSAVAGCLFPSLAGLSGADSGLDSGLEGGSDVNVSDAPSGPFCKNVDATFCDDFDDTNSAIFPKWGYATSDDGGALLRIDAGLSAPNAIEAIINASDGGPPVVERVSLDFPAATARVHLVYDFFVDAYDNNTGSFALLADVEVNGAGTLGVRLRLQAAGGQLETAVYATDGGTTFPDIGPGFSVTSGAWHHVDEIIDTSKSVTTVSLTFDSAPVTTNTPIPGATFGPGPASLEGPILYATTPTTGWQVRMDNIAIWLQ